MSDRIEIRGLRVLGHHGALPGEKDRAQPFELDVDVVTDMERAARSDDLSDAVDYGALVVTAAEIVATRRFALLEALAGAIADALLAYDGVQAVEVAVKKLRPPIAHDVATVAVRLSRSRVGK